MNQITIYHTYYCGVSDTIDLPEGKTVEDINEVHIKYGTITLDFNDGTSYSEETDGDVSDSIDWKRPLNYQSYRCDKEAGTDYSEELNI